MNNKKTITKLRTSTRKNYDKDKNYGGQPGKTMTKATDGNPGKLCQPPPRRLSLTPPPYESDSESSPPPYESDSESSIPSPPLTDSDDEFFPQLKQNDSLIKNTHFVPAVGKGILCVRARNSANTNDPNLDSASASGTIFASSVVPKSKSPFVDKDFETYIYLKLQNGITTVDCKSGLIKKLDIHVCLRNALRLEKDTITNCLSLTDQPRDDNNVTGSHSKCLYYEGKTTNICIFVRHSAPRWPAINFDPNDVSTFTLLSGSNGDKAGGQRRKVQHFSVLRYKYKSNDERDLFRKLVFEHIINMNRLNYRFFINTLKGDALRLFNEVKRSSQICVGVITRRITQKIQFVSKPSHISIDLYAHIAKTFGSILVLDHGHRCRQAPTGSISHVETVKDKSDRFEQFRRSQNHSKIAITTKASGLKLVFIGDLNREDSQLLRGGGFTIMDDEDLWTYFYSIFS